MSIGRELAYSARQLARTPAFTIPSVAGLAIAIGVTTAVFSIFSAMLLRSMGFDDTARIVAIWQTDEPHGQKQVEISYGDLLEWRKAKDTLSEVALASSVNLDFPLFAGAQPEYVDGTTVSGNFFRALGATPLAGRFFTEDDDRPGAPLRVVLSYNVWRSKLGGDYRVIGRQYRVGADTVTVIGITRPEFDFPRDVALFVPLRASWPTVEQNPRLRVFRCVARLAPGITPAQARARLDVIARQMESTAVPGSVRYSPSVTPIPDEIYGAARPAVRILLAAVFIVVLIACANAANLLLARAAQRSRELAIRSALGAARRRLLRLLFGESLLLAAASGVIGLGLAVLAVKALVHLAPPEVPRMEQASIDGGVLAFGVLLSVATVLLFGLTPAVVASERDPSEALKEAGQRASSGRSHSRLRRALVAAEVALSVVLLVGAGLLVRSFANLAAIDPGFRADHILTFRITTEKGDQEARRAMYSQVLERVRSLPGVESAGAILLRPLSGVVGWDTTYLVGGQSPAEQKNNPNGNYEAISPGYFRTMRIRVLAGRDFTSADTHNSSGVVIVNEATARRHWPGDGAVGKRIRLGSDPKAPWLTVVGVVSDVRYREWEASRPDFYVPYLQRAQHRSDFVVRTAAAPWAVAEAIRTEVFAVDKNQPISNVTTMDELVDRALARARFNGFILSLLGLCAMVLAALGIYGVLSYAVAQRSAEIGIRIALGASPSRVSWLITADGLMLVGTGLAIGLATALLLRELVASQLFGVSPGDPLTYAAAAVSLVFAGLLACVTPAVRAAKVDPVRAIQS